LIRPSRLPLRPRSLSTPAPCQQRPTPWPITTDPLRHPRTTTTCSSLARRCRPARSFRRSRDTRPRLVRPPRRAWAARTATAATTATLATTPVRAHQPRCPRVRRAVSSAATARSRRARCTARCRLSRPPRHPGHTRAEVFVARFQRYRDRWRVRFRRPGLRCPLHQHLHHRRWGLPTYRQCHHHGPEPRDAPCQLFQRHHLRSQDHPCRRHRQRFPHTNRPSARCPTQPRPSAALPFLIPHNRYRKLHQSNRCGRQATRRRPTAQRCRTPRATRTLARRRLFRPV
jgi:hypothetical protein